MVPKVFVLLDSYVGEEANIGQVMYGRFGGTWERPYVEWGKAFEQW
jgi:hypothetical protein